MTMRIPSNLHDDPLYGRRGRGSAKSDGIRKLIRLGVALALVVVVMRQAGRPDVYAPFFATGRGDLAEETQGSETGGSETAVADGPEADGVDGVSGQEEEAGQTQEAGRDREAERTQGPSHAGDGANRPGEDGQRLAESEAFRTVVDGGPWRGGDHDAFSLLLKLARDETAAARAYADGGHTDGKPGPLVGVLPLLQQPDVYRGKRVRVRGSVARVVPRQTDDGRGDPYWEMWLRPHDGAERPMLVIVPSVPGSIEELVGTTLIDDGPVVSVDGRFLKRLAYRATSGAEVTPVVIGRLILGSGGGDAIAEPALAERPQWSTIQVVSLVAASVIFGVGLAGFLMWRTARDGARLRRLRRPVRFPPVLLGLVTGLGIASGAGFPFGAGSPVGIGSLRAESAVELLSGFDAARIGGILRSEGDDSEGDAPADDPVLEDVVAVDELAKLLFRIRRLDPDTLFSRLPPEPDGLPTDRAGEVVRFSGRVVRGRPIEVPESLRELLDLERIDLYVIADGEDPVARVYLPGFDRPASVGDRLDGVGVSLGTGRTIAAGSVRWVPATFPDVGWELLASSGFDLGEISGLVRRSRRPLTEADTDAFYGMLAAAKRIASRGDVSGGTKATRVDPVTLLRDPADHVGRWLRMRVETVRLTRVSLAEDPGRRDQVGQDHYFQIDAIGDLGNVEVRIDGAAAGEEPIRFRNRYPVTVVTPELPGFLENEIAASSGRETVVASVSVPVDIDGFFFRLWSYESDFMSRRGGEQFGPMVVAARWTDRRSGESDPAGVSRIGWWAASAVIGALLAVVAWSIVTGRRDARVREARRRREAEQVGFPPGST